MKEKKVGKERQFASNFLHLPKDVIILNFHIHFQPYEKNLKYAEDSSTTKIRQSWIFYDITEVLYEHWNPYTQTFWYV